MTNDTPQTKISSGDVEGIAAKLEQFAESLPEQERNVLGWILTRAQAAGEADTAGFGFGTVAPQLLGEFRTPMAAQLARSAGLGPVAGTTEVTWAYKFGKEFGGMQERIR